MAKLLQRLRHPAVVALLAGMFAVALLVTLVVSDAQMSDHTRHVVALWLIGVVGTLGALVVLGIFVAMILTLRNSTVYDEFI